MPTNVFFSPKVNTEQYMFEDIIIESIKMYGQDVFYMPRKIVQRDYILGEDVESEFNTANTVEMFIENTEGFEGEGNIFAKFGMEIRDEVTFIVAKRSWQKLVGVWNSDINDDRPFEGDLIYLPLSKSFFEISYVEHEQPFYQLSNLPVFKLQARLFEYNDEEFNTGVAAVDELKAQYGYQEIFEVGSISGTFKFGERIKHISTAAISSSAAAVGNFGTNRGLGRLTAVDISTAGFSYASIPAVSIITHDDNDKELEGSKSNSIITKDQPKFSLWSVFSNDNTKYYYVDLPNKLQAGTAEFFFKTKDAQVYNGVISQFGDFQFTLGSNGITSNHKTDTVTTAINTSDWNHVKVSVNNAGGTFTYQIFINGTRVLNGTTVSNSALIASGGQYLNTKEIKVQGALSAANTPETNGIYFDAVSVSTVPLADATTIPVPTAIQTNDVINESFDPINATATATLDASGSVSAITLVNRGRYYPALPAVTITPNSVASTPEVSISAELISIDSNTVHITDIETTDGTYTKFATGNSIVGVTSGATASITKIYDVDTSTTDNTFVTDLAARNFNYEDEADDIIDFSESNPFGEA